MIQFSSNVYNQYLCISIDIKYDVNINNRRGEAE